MLRSWTWRSQTRYIATLFHARVIEVISSYLYYRFEKKMNLLNYLYVSYYSYRAQWQLLRKLCRKLRHKFRHGDGAKFLTPLFIYIDNENYIMCSFKGRLFIFMKLKNNKSSRIRNSGITNYQVWCSEYKITKFGKRVKCSSSGVFSDFWMVYHRNKYSFGW
jgi:hypothetical protein